MADLDTTVEFGCTSQFGTLTGWNPEDPTINETSSVATTSDGDGDVTDAKPYDTTTEVTQAFKAASASAPTLPASIGGLLNGRLITKLSIKTKATDFVTMELTGHNHAVSPHDAESDHRELTHGITLASGFGAVDFLGSTLGAAAAIESSDLDIEIQHTDITAGQTGSHFVGGNWQGHLTCKQTFRGNPTTAADSSWKVVPSKSKTYKKGDYVTVVVTAEKWIALAIPE